MSAPSPRARSKSRAAALIGSFALHVLLFMGMVMTLRLPVQPPEPQPMQVDLYSSPSELRKLQPRIHAGVPDSVRPQAPRPTAPPPPAPVPDIFRLPGPLTRNLPHGPIFQRPMADVTPFYRDHIQGCGKEDLALMSPEDREKCQVRIATQELTEQAIKAEEARKAKPILRLDPDRRAEFDKELGRRRQRAANNDPIKPCDGPTVGLGSACLNHDKPPE